MSSTLSSLVDDVNLELQNHEQRGSATATGDGDTRAFIVAPMCSYITDDYIWTVEVDGAGVGSDTYVMDFTTGVCTFVIAPDLSSVVNFVFNYTPFHPDMVEQAINAAINNLFPSFYVKTSTVIAASSSTNYEYTLPATAEFVTGVFGGDSATGPWERLTRSKRYEVEMEDGVASLRFYAEPEDSYLRVRYIARPQPISSGDTIEETAGLPSRAKDPIISYACYYLLTQKLAPRTRADVAIATQGQGVLTPRQMNDTINTFFMRYQFQMASLKMLPWTSK